MKNIIRELWRENISPSKDANALTPTLKEMYEQLEEIEEILTENFSKEEKRLLEKYADIYCDCSIELQETAFVYGMKLGIQIILDAMKD